MSKQSGLGDALLIGGYDLSGDTGSVDTVNGGPVAGDFTGIDKSAPERIGLLRDGHLGWMSFFNDAAGQAHPVLSALPTADVIGTYCRGTALGGNAASINGKQLDYAGSRAADGMFTFKVQIDANGYGLEWGNLLTAGKRTDTSGTNGTGVDLTTVSTAFGWQAYLHVTALTGTNVIVTIQDSADNGTFANLTGGAFTSATAVGAQRLAGGSTATVRRYLRVVSSGTFTSATFLVNFVRNATAVSF